MRVKRDGIGLGLAVAMVIGGCTETGGGASAPAAPAEPAPPAVLGGVRLDEPMRAIGTEPFWDVEITPGALTYSALEAPATRFDHDGPTVQGTTARWIGAAEGGREMRLDLMATECSDGMSDRVYPLTAIVQLGDTTLNGCAQSIAALQAEPRP